MNKDDLIRENLHKVCDYGREIQGKKFSIPQNCPDTEVGRKIFSTARNEMARAVIFEINWRKFQVFASKCHDTWTQKKTEELSCWIF